MKSQLRSMYALAALAAVPPTNAAAQDCSVYATIPVGHNPVDVAINPTTNRIYTKSFSGPTVSVIDGATSTLLTTLPVSDFMGTVSVNPVTNRVYVGSGFGSIDVFDGVTHALITSFFNPWCPTDSSVDSVLDRVLMVNNGSNDVTVIDGATNTPLGNIGITGPLPSAADFLEGSGFAYVATFGGTLSVIDVNALTEIVSFPIGGSFAQVIVDPVTSRGYAIDGGTTTITVFDLPLGPVVGSLTAPVPCLANEASLDAAAGILYLVPVDSSDNRMFQLDVNTNTVVDTSTAGGFGAIVHNPATGMLYNNRFGANTVEVIGCCASGPATATFRNAGSNPASLTTTPPVLGQVMTATVDLTTTGHTLAYVAAYASALTFTLGGGEVLLMNVADPGGELPGQGLALGPTATFNVPVPGDTSFCGFFAAMQAAHLGGLMPFVLSNAQDIVTGGH